MTPLLNLVLVLTGGCNVTNSSSSPLGLNNLAIPFSLHNGNSSVISVPNCDCNCHGIPIVSNICEMFQKLGLCGAQNPTANKAEEITTTLSSDISTTVSPEKKDVTAKSDSGKTDVTKPSPKKTGPKSHDSEPHEKDYDDEDDDVVSPKPGKMNATKSDVGKMDATTLSPKKTSPKLYESSPDRDDEDDEVLTKKPTADKSSTSKPLLNTTDGVTPAKETTKVPSEDDKKTTKPKTPESSTKDSEDDKKDDGVIVVTEPSRTTAKKVVGPSSGEHTDDDDDDDDASKTKSSDADAKEDDKNTATTPMNPYSKAAPKTSPTELNDEPVTEKTKSPESPKDDEDDKKISESSVTESSHTTAKNDKPSSGGRTDDDHESSLQKDDPSRPNKPATPKRFDTEPSDDYSDKDDEKPFDTDSDDKVSKKPKVLKTTTESVPSEETPKPENKFDDKNSTGLPVIESRVKSSEVEPDSSHKSPKSDLDNCLEVDKDAKFENIALQPSENETLNNIINSINEFDLDLTKAVLRDNTTNYAISPINFALLLLMAENGACSDSKKELDDTLHLSKKISKEELRPIKFLVDSLKDINQTKLFLGDKIFLPENVKIRPEYKNLIQAAYQSDPLSVDYKKVNDVVEQINRWGANKTNNYVQNVISSNESVISEDTSLLLAGVGYFQANWVHSFDRLFNDHKLFYVGQNTYKSVCTMLQINKFYYYHMDDLPAGIIELPLRTDTDKELKMIVILPDEENALSDVIENLHKFNYTDFQIHAKLEIVELSLPKFKIQSFINLQNYSDQININNTLDNPNFCCVSEKAKISRILQKTVIKVNEGECAGLYHLCELDDHSCMANKIKFKVNRPFIFFIIKDQTIIFSGQIIDPSHD